nr:hypothetical protein [uncultured Rhizobium sp.]
MSDMQAAVWETVVFSHATALSRWEGEGGSPCGRDQVATTVRSGG